jgi:sulfur carrier protein ThiS
MGSVSIRLAPGFSMEKNEFSYDIQEQTNLADLMVKWGSQHSPEALDRLFDPETEYIASTMMILLNGKSVKSDDPKTTMISPGDSIYITPILLGG